MGLGRGGLGSGAWGERIEAWVLLQGVGGSWCEDKLGGKSWVFKIQFFLGPLVLPHEICTHVPWAPCAPPPLTFSSYTSTWG